MPLMFSLSKHTRHGIRIERVRSPFAALGALTNS
jgi:hypothetical protein